ncbi:AAA family ATPase, partial [Acetobacter sp.]|uniref:AAA family ATPase n=1 Tax=Acetobacter sp. TaxID=440 RepID=UPI0039E9D68A
LKETRPFLSEAADRELPVLGDAFKWISFILTPVEATSSYAPLFERMGGDEAFRAFLEGFMTRCDVGISSLRAKSSKVDPSVLIKMPESLKNQIDLLEKNEILGIESDDGVSMVFAKNEDDDIVVKNIEAIRNDSDGKEIEFSFDEESSGTRRLLDLAPMLADEEDQRVYIVDELDRKLHPLLSYQFVQEFLSKKRKSQLILTTHNTHLMDLELLRRDEIWFVQKKPDGSSELYSLAEMKIRPDLNVKKGYISGRFGAIPFLGHFPSMEESI